MKYKSKVQFVVCLILSICLSPFLGFSGVQAQTDVLNQHVVSPLVVVGADEHVVRVSARVVTAEEARCEALQVSFTELIQNNALINLNQPIDCLIANGLSVSALPVSVGLAVKPFDGLRGKVVVAETVNQPLRVQKQSEPATALLVPVVSFERLKLFGAREVWRWSVADLSATVIHHHSLSELQVFRC